MSLKKQLLAKIKENGILTYSELENFCHVWQYKLSNAERRLRELCNEEDIEPIRKKNYISGWRARGKELQMKLGV